MVIGGYLYPIGPLYEHGMRIAIEALAGKGILNDFNVILDFFDEKCDHALGIRLTVELLEKAKTSNANVVPILVGPTCAEIVYIQQYVKNYDFIQASQNLLKLTKYFTSFLLQVADTSVITSMFYDRSRFGSDFSLLPSFETNYEGVAAFIQHHGWTRVFLLSETFTFWEPVSFHCEPFFVIKVLFLV